jgi:hypothetical protein
MEPIHWLVIAHYTMVVLTIARLYMDIRDRR